MADLYANIYVYVADNIIMPQGSGTRVEGPTNHNADAVLEAAV